MVSTECLYQQECNTPYYLKIWVVCETIDSKSFKITVYYSDWPYSKKENNSSSYEGVFNLAILVEFLKLYGYKKPNGLVKELKPYWGKLILALIDQVEKDIF